MHVLIEALRPYEPDPKYAPDKAMLDFERDARRLVDREIQDGAASRGAGVRSRVLPNGTRQVVVTGDLLAADPIREDILRAAKKFNFAQLGDPIGGEWTFAGRTKG